MKQNYGYILQPDQNLLVKSILDGKTSIIKGKFVSYYIPPYGIVVITCFKKYINIRLKLNRENKDHLTNEFLSAPVRNGTWQKFKNRKIL